LGYFPGKTFRVLKEKEEKQFGEYRTNGLVLVAWDKLFEERTSGSDLKIEIRCHS
jgi:tRNA A37 threonylcarbamoyladenosine biosynthesis protein TsaE